MNAGYVIGGDVGGTRVKYVLVGDDGAVLGQSEIDTDPRDAGRTLARLAAAVRRDAGEGAGAPDGVGLACAGVVDARAGRLGRAPNLPGWEGADLAAGLAAAFGPVRGAFANDVNAALHGEYRLGAGRGCRDLVMLAIGTGVGGGVLVDGRLVTGRNFGAGEIGHLILDPEGPRCTCGNRGCLEAYAGGWALVRAARELASAGRAGPELSALAGAGGERPTPLDLARAAAAGDEGAAAILDAAGKRLGQAVAGLVNVLDPDRVIVGGGVAQAGDAILAPCRAAVRENVLCEASRATPVVVAELGPHAAALGAALLVREAGAER